MVRARRTPRFDRAYGKLTEDQKLAVDAAIANFFRDVRHPGLHFEKLSGSDYRTIRAGLGIRIVLLGTGGDFDFVDVAKHDYVDKRYG